MRLRRLAAATTVACLALGSGAAERPRLRPVNLYLSTGSADSDCTPTHLTTRAVGQSDCGPVSPLGGSTTWKADPNDDGFPFLAAGDQEAVVTIVIEDGTGLGAPGDYSFTIDVTLAGDFEVSASHAFDFDPAGGDETVEFTIPIEQEGWIDGGSVTVTGTGAGVPVGYSVNGSGSSFIRILPAAED